MKIIEIIPTLGAGGADRLVADLSNSLYDQGNDIHLILLMKMIPRNCFYIKDINPNIHIYSLNKGIGFSFHALLKLIKLIIKIKPDVVHAHLNSIFYIFLPAVFNCMGIKYVYTVHNDANKDASNKLFAFIMKLLFTHNKVLPITISYQSEYSFKQFYGFPSYKTIFNGRNVKEVDVPTDIKNNINKYRWSSKTVVLLYLARFTEQKRPYLHAKICNDLYNEGFDLVLLMFGENSSNEDVVNQIRKLDSKCVHIMGVTSDVLQYMKECDALLLLSSYEGLPIVLIESLAVGCIPICTPVGGVNDMIQSGYNGYLALDCSESECYNILRHFLLTSADERNIVKTNAIKSYELYTMERCSKQYIDVFRI